MWRIGSFGAVVVLVAACSSAGDAPAGPGAPISGASIPPATASVPASPPPTPSPPPAPSPSRSPDAPASPAGSYVEFQKEFCAAWAALFRAVGNPDTGSGSDLSKAFDAAIREGDGATAREKAAAVMAELETGRQHIAAGAHWTTGAPLMGQMDRLFAAFEASYAAQRDAVDRGAQEAQRLGQEALTQAGGLDAWYALIRPGVLDATRQAIGSARPAGAVGQCEGLPIGL